KNDIVIVRRSATDYIALSQTCTHLGCTVGYDHSTGTLPCDCHDSKFDIDGSVINGPAKKDLVLYNTQLDGDQLRIFS
ncbi:MAG: Rieske 2Fe-2S domain-containing protein, partial [Bacteroidetes bacterium]|nr:Rieske 2Fe-2S domain-containing protein [Bacteroidota bacterium]